MQWLEFYFSKHQGYIRNHLPLYVTNSYIFVCPVTHVRIFYVPYSCRNGGIPCQYDIFTNFRIWPNKLTTHGPIFSISVTSGNKQAFVWKKNVYTEVQMDLEGQVGRSHISWPSYGHVSSCVALMEEIEWNLEQNGCHSLCMSSCQLYRKAISCHVLLQNYFSFSGYAFVIYWSFAQIRFQYTCYQYFKCKGIGWSIFSQFNILKNECV